MRDPDTDLEMRPLHPDRTTSTLEVNDLKLVVAEIIQNPRAIVVFRGANHQMWRE